MFHFEMIINEILLFTLCFIRQGSSLSFFGDFWKELNETFNDT